MCVHACVCACVIRRPSLAALLFDILAYRSDGSCVEELFTRDGCDCRNGALPRQLFHRSLQEFLHGSSLVRITANAFCSAHIQ